MLDVVCSSTILSNHEFPLLDDGILWDIIHNCIGTTTWCDKLLPSAFCKPSTSQTYHEMEFPIILQQNRFIIASCKLSSETRNLHGSKHVLLDVIFLQRQFWCHLAFYVCLWKSKWGKSSMTHLPNWKLFPRNEIKAMCHDFVLSSYR